MKNKITYYLRTLNLINDKILLQNFFYKIIVIFSYTTFKVNILFRN